MARRSRMSMLKRQREVKKSEKAARKRAKRHGVHEEGFTEPRPTVIMGELTGARSVDDADAPESASEDNGVPQAEQDPK